MIKKIKSFLCCTLKFFFIDLFFIKNSSTIKYVYFTYRPKPELPKVKLKHQYFNLNLPETQSHSFHLFDEQKIHYKRVKYSHNWVNGFSVLIPILLALGLFCFCFFFVNYMWLDVAYLEIFGTLHQCGAKNHLFGYRNCFYYLFLVIWILFLWFEHVRFEGVEGYHTQKVNTDYKMAFVLFLISEVMFFFSVFWAFFHFSVGANIDLGYIWPPVGISTISYLNLPLINTLILITSGLFVTWSHNGLKVGNYEAAEKGLFYTIVFGVIFLLCQLLEYYISGFNINDSVFGSIFFFGTGFHGVHVFLGTLSLVYNYFKLRSAYLSSTSHYSYLFTIWYWHFVDVIWLFLYIIFYVWGQ